MSVRVAHITTVDLSLRYLLLGQLRDLQAAGYEVSGISSPGEHVPVLEAAGIRHIAVTITRRPFSPLADLRALWRLYQTLRRERFDVVHTHTPKAGIFGRIAARLAGVPVIVHTSHGFIFHDGSPWWFRRWFILLETLAARCCDLIFSVNREDVDMAVGEGICAPDKIQPLGGEGVDTRAFDPARFSADDMARQRAALAIPDGTRVVGFIGRLVKEKGLLELFEAARLVRAQHPDVRFLIVGPVDHAKADAVTPEAAEAYGVADICHFLGMRADVADLYPLMDVFVLPSHREGFPRAPMEAAAMGVPCIVTDIRGCREVVQHGRNGLLVPRGDAAALAAAIVHLLSNHELAQQLGREGRRMAVTQFDERLVFEKVKAAYARLLAAKGLPVPASARAAALETV